MANKRGLKLETINRVLGWFGLVLVACVDTEGGEPTRVWLEQRARYLARCRENQNRRTLEIMAKADAILAEVGVGE